MTFVDLTKACDTANREYQRLKRMAKFGCQPRYKAIVRQDSVMKCMCVVRMMESTLSNIW